MRRLALLLLVACNHATYVFTPSVKGFVAKPDDCPLDVVTSNPERGYTELGELTFYDGKEPKTLEAFKDAVHKQVCEIGATAVVAIADDKGQYTKGTVLAYTDSGATPSATKAIKEPVMQQTDNELPK